jgi:hypothetical protein
MPLIDIRKQFIEFSGRYDLVLDTTDFDNNGADTFITAGQRWLDRTYEVLGSVERFDTLLDIGNWYALITDARVIESVWVSLVTGERYPLCYLSMSDFRASFSKDPIEITNGRISYYTPVFFYKVPDSYDVLIDAIGNNEYVVSTPMGYNGLLCMPPTDQQINLEVHGKFYQPKLVNNNDANLWSEAYPTALVLAACRQVEISYRNQTGVKDYEAGIEGELRGAEFDLVDSQTNQMPHLKG